MEILAHPVCAVTLGIFLSLCYFLISTDNPARIPLHKILFKSLFGMILYVLTWLAVAYPIYRLLLLPTNSLVGQLEGFAANCFACVVGLSVPIIIRQGKNQLLGRRTARTYRLLTIVLQFVDEITSQYFGRIIMREERKASFEVLEGDAGGAERAIERLFELYIEAIATEEAKTLKPAERERVFNFVKMRSPAVKFKFLLRHLGYTVCFKKIRAVQNDPESILPTWPKEIGDRRHGSDQRKAVEPHAPERRRRAFGRRRLDSPHTRACILGKDHRNMRAPRNPQGELNS